MSFWHSKGEINPTDRENFSRSGDIFALFPGLRRLSLALKRGDSTILADEPLTLDELEMLEAEISKQGYLPPVRIRDGQASGVTTIAQRASLEIAFLRWRVRRIARLATVHFRIHLPEYLLRWAGELSAQPTQSDDAERLNFRSRDLNTNEAALVDAQLKYLDAIAGALLAAPRMESSELANRTLGERLVLRALSHPHQPLDEHSLKDAERMIVLPLPPNDLAELQKRLSDEKHSR